MPVNISNVLGLVQGDVGSANSTSDTQDFVYLSKAIKRIGTNAIQTYANTSALPANGEVLIAYVQSERNLYMYANSTWKSANATIPPAV